MWPRGFMWLKVAKNVEKLEKSGEKVVESGEKWGKMAKSREKWR